MFFVDADAPRDPVLKDAPDSEDRPRRPGRSTHATDDGSMGGILFGPRRSGGSKVLQSIFQLEATRRLEKLAALDRLQRHRI